MIMRQHILVSVLLAGAALSVLPACLPAQAQLFGESDKDKAARLQHEADQDQQLQQLGPIQDRLRDLSDRIQSLESSLQRATGNEESLGHQIQLLQDKVDQQQKDFNYRLCVISAQQLGTTADESGLNCAAASSGNGTYLPPARSQGPANAPAPGSLLPPIGSGQDMASGPAAPPPLRGRSPGTLGTLPSGSASDTAQFDTGMNLMAKSQYAQAAAAFSAYADSHHDDAELTPQAIFWIGNMAFVQQDYQGAARNFALLEQKYPTSPRAAEGMVKLGQSLIATGDNKDACTAFATVTKKKYPDVSDATLTAAANARKASCKK